MYSENWKGREWSPGGAEPLQDRNPPRRGGKTKLIPIYPSLTSWVRRSSPGGALARAYHKMVVLSEPAFPHTLEAPYINKRA